tara:strand:+ start:447 stop:791 length:345 start_codon:yes stop_codon:yes gene_type:complete
VILPNTLSDPVSPRPSTGVNIGAFGFSDVTLVSVFGASTFGASTFGVSTLGISALGISTLGVSTLGGSVFFSAGFGTTLCSSRDLWLLLSLIKIVDSALNSGVGDSGFLVSLIS